VDDEASDLPAPLRIVDEQPQVKRVERRHLT
jgi:hypothetical protein